MELVKTTGRMKKMQTNKGMQITNRACDRRGGGREGMD